MKYKSKSIKTVLNERQKELYQALSSKYQFAELKQTVLNILNSDELKGNRDVEKAKQAFFNARNNYNLYLSILTAYMTGIAIGK